MVNKAKINIVQYPQDTTSTGGPGGNVDHQFLDYLGESPFLFSFNDTLKADSTLETQITFIELLKYRSGEMLYVYPAKLPTFTGQTINRFEIAVTLNSERTITDFNSPSNPDCNIEFGPGTGSLSYRAENISSLQNFSAAYAVSQEEFGVFVTGVKPPGEDGYFLMLAEPDPSTSQQQVIDKIFTYIIDVSGSMSGEKILQAKEAARYCIEHLNAGDKFNIIKFNSSATRFRNQPIDATMANIQLGLDWIDALQAGGGTNLGEALLSGLDQNMGSETSNIFIFLTDGRGSINFDEVKAANTKNVSIFVFGIGQGVDEITLRRIAADNNGIAEFLGNDQVANRIPDFYNKIKDPLILNVEVDFTGGDIKEVYPLQLPDIYVGEQLVITGRYQSSGSATVDLVGKSINDTVRYTYTFSLPDDSTGNIFIPKMWAKQKIESLLLLIAQFGEDSNQGKEYIVEVIRLSKKYGIMTPYTSFKDEGDATGVEFEDLVMPDATPFTFQLMQNLLLFHL
jgi:Ca-activated chloride channel family protein